MKVRCETDIEVEISFKEEPHTRTTGRFPIPNITFPARSYPEDSQLEVRLESKKTEKEFTLYIPNPVILEPFVCGNQIVIKEDTLVTNDIHLKDNGSQYRLHIEIRDPIFQNSLAKFTSDYFKIISAKTYKRRQGKRQQAQAPFFQQEQTSQLQQEQLQQEQLQQEQLHQEQLQQEQLQQEQLHQEQLQQEHLQQEHLQQEHLQQQELVQQEFNYVPLQSNLSGSFPSQSSFDLASSSLNIDSSILEEILGMPFYPCSWMDSEEGLSPLPMFDPPLYTLPPPTPSPSTLPPSTLSPSSLPSSRPLVSSNGCFPNTPPPPTDARHEIQGNLLIIHKKRRIDHGLVAHAACFKPLVEAPWNPRECNLSVVPNLDPYISKKLLCESLEYLAVVYTSSLVEAEDSIDFLTKHFSTMGLLDKSVELAIKPITSESAITISIVKGSSPMLEDIDRQKEMESFYRSLIVFSEKYPKIANSWRRTIETRGLCGFYTYILPYMNSPHSPPHHIHCDSERCAIEIIS